MKITLLKFRYLALLLCISLITTAAFKKNGITIFSCKGASWVDSAKDAEFQRFLNFNYPILEKYVDLADSIDAENASIAAIDSLINKNQKFLFGLLVQIADSSALSKLLKNRLDESLVGDFIKKWGPNFDSSDKLKVDLSISEDEVKTAIVLLEKNRSDSAKYQNDLGAMVLLNSKLSKKSVKFDSIVNKFKNDSSLIRDKFKFKLDEINTARRKVDKLSIDKRRINGSIDSLKMRMQKDLATTYKSKYSVSDINFITFYEKSKNTTFEISNAEKIKKSSEKLKKELEFKKSKQQKSYLEVSNSIDIILSRDTVPVTQYHFYFKDDKHFFTFCVINTDSFDIKVHNNSTKSGRTLKDQFDVLKSLKVIPVALMNGGMFNTDYGSTGLMITSEGSKNKVVAPLNENEGFGNFFMKPNGVFFVDSSNKYFVMSTPNFKSYTKSSAPKYLNIKFATQSGPMLITNNVMNKLFSKASTNLNIRNAVGVSSKYPKKLFIAISDDKVSFYDMAFLFQHVFKCENALYLDGAVSKMYLKDSKSKINNLPDNSQPLGPIISVSKKHKS